MNYTDEIHIDSNAGSASAQLLICPEADYLKDHFPSAPMLPGLVMLEGAVRTAEALWRARRRRRDDNSLGAELDLVERLHLLRRVVPDETLVVQVEMQTPEISEAAETARFKAQAAVNGEVAMRAVFCLRSLEKTR